MITKQLNWIHVKREDLSKFLIDGFWEAINFSIEPKEVLLKDSFVALGYDVVKQNGLSYPSVMLISESSSREFFAWVSTYTPEIFPVSQFVRIMTLSEYQSFNFFSISSHSAKEHSSTSALSCLVLGEILSQIENVDKMDLVPISRAVTCWSTSVARCLELYGRRSVAEICFKRFYSFSHERRFFKKNIDLDDVAQVFGVFDQMIFKDGVFEEKVYFVFKHLFEDEYYKFPNGLTFKNMMDEFSTNSFEKRVVAYRKISNAILSDEKMGAKRISFILALAAFLVGGGTSHIFLLKDFGARFPSTYMWFGLISSFSGVDKWSSEWIKLVKLIEKILKQSFQLHEPSVSEFSWLEFEWILKTYESNDFFYKFPRFSPNGVTVEVCPGVTFQYRFSGDIRSSLPMTTVVNEKQNYISEDVKNIFSQFIEISRKMEIVMRQSENFSLNGNLNENMKSKIAAKKSRIKRTDD